KLTLYYCLGLLKRIPKLLINDSINQIKDDLEGFKYLTKFLVNDINLGSINNLKKKIPISSYENFNPIYFQLNTISINNKNLLTNNIFKDFYKNFYKTNIITEHSVNMNMLST